MVSWKPEVLYSLPVHPVQVLDAIFVPNRDTIITSAKDSVLRVYRLRLDTKKYWPTFQESLSSNAHILLYSEIPSTDPERSHRVFAGQDNGTITEYYLVEDNNKIVRCRDILAHQAAITGMMLSIQNEWLISVSRDKLLRVCSIQNTETSATHFLDRPATSLACDLDATFCFVGDVSGEITIVRLDRKTPGSLDFSVVNTLRGHGGAVTNLCWDNVHSRLFSSAEDKLVILWDVGGNQGNALDLHGHSGPATSVIWWALGQSSAVRPQQTKESNARERLVISSGLDRQLLFWLITPDRKPTPGWQNSDTCQVCGCAFFWNLAKSFSDFTIGKRQHHCRRCGRAICENCSASSELRLPLLGYESLVRVCKDCYPKVTDEEQQSLVLSVPLHDSITKMHLDEARNQLITVDEGKSVRIWSLNQPA